MVSKFFTLFLIIVQQSRVISAVKQSWEVNEQFDGAHAVFGDMVLTPAQMLRYETADQLAIRGVSVKESPYNRWINNVVPIVISPQYSASQKATLQGALKMFEQVSCFRFVERAAAQRDYLFIVPLDGCYSYVGKIGGRQTVSLAADCIADYIIWHEMMHALGFEHEHQRPDRDNFIRVDYQNVQPGQLINFDKLHANLVDFPDDYDYKSIMHYDGFAFGKVDTTRRVRLATMTPIKNGVTLVDNMKFTQADIDKLNRLGKCPSRPSQLSSQNNGAVSQDCRDTATAVSCEGNKRRGMCKNPFYRGMMIKSCQKTCRLCMYNRGTDAVVIPPTTTAPKCEDKSTRCQMYFENGMCTHRFYAEVRGKICAKTCGLC